MKQSTVKRQPMKRHIADSSFRQNLTRFLYIVIFGAIGLILIKFVLGATLDYSAEPEDGTLSGNVSVVTDSNASGGKAVKLNAQSNTSGLSSIEIVAMPHPDDEMEAWSLIENTSSNYKLFVYFTQGDETGYCVPANFASSYQPQYGEAPPYMTPTGQWTTECHESRISSNLNFLNTMSEKDSSLPGGFSDQSYTMLTLPANGYTLGHVDNGVFKSDSRIRIYDSVTGNTKYGKVLFFNLGDSDLTSSEVIWAIEAIKSNKETLGIPNLPFSSIVGPYNHTGEYANCVIYNHPDHYAVHTALYTHDFGMMPGGYQTAATCANDPDTVRTKDVTATSWNNAFYINPTTWERVGFMQKYYGWLDGDSGSTNLPNTHYGWYNNTSTSSQSSTIQTPFMRHQTFWQKFPH